MITSWEISKVFYVMNTTMFTLNITNIRMTDISDSKKK